MHQRCFVSLKPCEVHCEQPRCISIISTSTVWPIQTEKHCIKRVEEVNCDHHIAFPLLIIKYILPQNGFFDVSWNTFLNNKSILPRSL